MQKLDLDTETEEEEMEDDGVDTNDEEDVFKVTVVDYETGINYKLESVKGVRR